MLNNKKLIKYMMEHSDEVKDIIADCPSCIEQPSDIDHSKYDNKKAVAFALLKWKPAIICASIIVLIVIVLLTPPGRTFANGAYTTVLNWFSNEDGTSLTVNHGPEAPPDIDNSIPETTFSEYSTLEELPKEYRDVYLYNDRFALSLIHAEKTETIDGYRCDYKYFKDDVEYNVTITHYNFTSSFIVDFADGEPITTKTADGLEVNGIWNAETCTAVTYLDNTEIYFAADNVPYEEFVSFIESTTIVY